MNRIFKYTNGGLTYKGIRMMTAEGVHEEVWKLVEEVILKRKRTYLKVLDLAAGQGAMVQRLLDTGFIKITPWVLEKEKYQVRSIKAKEVNLNSDFSKETQSQYDLILAIEVIEHLENPFHFLRETAKLLDPKGILILSTPNIESALSRIQFMVNGKYRWFNDWTYLESGHIQPISTWQLDKALEKAGLKILKRRQNLDVKIVTDHGIRNLLKATLALLIYPLMKDNKQGDINLFVISHENKKS